MRCLLESLFCICLFWDFLSQHLWCDSSPCPRDCSRPWRAHSPTLIMPTICNRCETHCKKKGTGTELHSSTCPLSERTWFYILTASPPREFKSRAEDWNAKLCSKIIFGRRLVWHSVFLSTLLLVDRSIPPHQRLHRLHLIYRGPVKHSLTSLSSKIYEFSLAWMHLKRCILLHSHAQTHTTGRRKQVFHMPGGRDGWMELRGEGGRGEGAKGDQQERELDLRRGENSDGSDGGREDELWGQEEREANGEGGEQGRSARREAVA